MAARCNLEPLFHDPLFHDPLFHSGHDLTVVLVCNELSRGMHHVVGNFVAQGLRH
jgi:hypothetical protein